MMKYAFKYDDSSIGIYNDEWNIYIYNFSHKTYKLLISQLYEMDKIHIIHNSLILVRYYNLLQLIYLKENKLFGHVNQENIKTILIR
jgi:hypothetical protein